MNDVDCMVVGAGVIGLAVGRELALRGRQVIILEQEQRIGLHTSSRNSEVVHSGIYYPPGSLKARLCVAGRELLHRYCAERGIALRMCGKFIVATSPDQLSELQALEFRARANGVADLEWRDGTQAVREEPALACAAALWSPSTGIIDSQAYLLSLLADAEAHGAIIVYRSGVSSLRSTRAGVEVCINDEAATVARAKVVVNCTGLDAHRVAASIDGFPAAHIPRIHFAKGSYFSLAGAAPFSRLIYPIPAAGGLGIHMSMDFNGCARFGPDVEWIEARDYTVDPNRAGGFTDAIRRYWPKISSLALAPAYSGIRPSLSGPGNPPADFSLSGPSEHGVAGVVNLFGIDSPGLTASLALATQVADMAAAAL